MSKKCIGCGISEEESRTRGDISAELNFPDDAINLEALGIDLKENQFMCIECRAHLLNNITGGKLDKNVKNTVAFESFVNSSAHLFKLEVAEVIQACFNIFEKSILTNNNGIEALQLLSMAKDMIERDIGIVKSSNEYFDEQEKYR